MAKNQPNFMTQYGMAKLKIVSEVARVRENMPLEAIMIEAIEQVEKIRRRLKRFAGSE